MRILLTSILVLGLGAAPVLAAPSAPKSQPAGVVLVVSGKVELYRAQGGGSSAPKAPKPGQTLLAGDRVKTGSNGRLALVLVDGTQLKLNYDTDITLEARDAKGHASARGIAAVKIFLGELWAKVTKKNSTLEFETPAAVAAVKGTEPLIEVGPDGSLCLQLRSGAVRLSNGRPGSVLLTPGEQICVGLGQTIQKSLVQPWAAGAATWEQTFNQATNAAVTVQYTDQNGVAKSFVLNYASANPTPSSTPARTPTVQP